MISVSHGGNRSRKVYRYNIAPFSKQTSSTSARRRKAWNEHSEGVGKRHHCVHLGEIFYLTAKLKNLDAAEMLLQRIQAMPVEVMSVSDTMVFAAARLKAQHRISAMRTPLRSRKVTFTQPIPDLRLRTCPS
jgi:hypothetical protein